MPVSLSSWSCAGRDLDRAAAEGGVHHVVRDDRHVAVHERDPHATADEGRVARVVGVHGDGRVAEDGLGAGGRDGDRRIRFRLARPLVEEVVADAVQRAGLGRWEGLEVADAGPAAGAPVDQRLGAIREVALVEAEEGLADGLRRDLVHRVPETAPVARTAHAALLGEDHVADPGHELAHPLEVGVAAQAGAALALPGEDPVEHELGGDARVVEPRQEQRRAPEHPCVADHHVLDRRPLRVPEVERARHVGRRLDQDERGQAGVGGRARAVRREDVGREPALVDVVLELGRHVGLRELLARRLGHGSLPTERKRPARPADERGRGTTCWFRAGCRVAHRGGVSGRALGALSGAIRTARERPSFRLVQRGSHRPALAWCRCRTYSSRSTP